MAATPAAIPARERGSIGAVAARAVARRKARPVSRFDQERSPMLHSKAAEALLLAVRLLDD